MIYSPEYLEEHDSTFVDDLKESQVSVWLAAKWLSSKGFNVTVRASSIRPDAKERMKYSDNGDLEIVQRVEVKRRRVDFTGAHDYPYPSVFVDVAHTYDNATVKPYAYLLINRKGTHCAVVLGKTRPQWIKSEKMDNHAGRLRTYYLCPVELCEFYPFS
jgi:hypothetical protein